MATQASGTQADPGKTRVGLVGVGNMGAPMCANMIKAGWKVAVYDTAPEKVRAVAEAHGAAAASSPSELGRQSDVVITMLPDGHVVR
jgi:3-hydroxyisobutyrate dehydrogenase-like beta-hydroxyacid dehydrogenase